MLIKNLNNKQRPSPRKASSLLAITTRQILDQWKPETTTAEKQQQQDAHLPDTKEIPPKVEEKPKDIQKELELLKSPAKFIYTPPNLEPDTSNLWISLHLRCITWRYLNFSIHVPVDTPIEMIRIKIIEHHEGTITNVVLYKDKVTKENLLVSDLKKTLLQWGFKGGTLAENKQAVIYYDFQSFEMGELAF